MIPQKNPFVNNFLRIFELFFAVSKTIIDYSELLYYYMRESVALQILTISKRFLQKDLTSNSMGDILSTQGRQRASEMKGSIKMIITLEKRCEFGNGTMTSHYELREYDHKSEHTGALIGGKTVKSFNTKKDADKYIGKNGITLCTED